ncbi:GGDEF domain-containing protein [Methylococcaceae bacterium WWC4]|nr:GGDEF domain-containing protein [Methylococcaceae bacterium WWC4]
MTSTPPDKTQQDSANTLVAKLSEAGRTRTELEPYLIMLSGHHQGKQYKLDKPQISLGRGADADICVPDPKISRQHCAFIRYPGYIVIADLNSTNGTFVNGKRIQKQRIDLLDRVRVGDLYLKIDYKRFIEARSEEELYQAANIDALTGILNRNAFMMRAQQELAFCKRADARMTIVMCDADHFKQKNDTYGHLAGDQILRELANILGAEMREEDLVARYGGEEFIMLLRESSVAASVAWAERIRLTVMNHSFRFQNRYIPTTISIGICSRPIDPFLTLEAIIQAADDALYLAKKNGRNRVEVAGD